MRRTAALLGLILLALPPGQAWAASDRVDPTIRPGDDFYAYANGPWLAEQQAVGLPDNSGTTAILARINRERTDRLIQGFAGGKATPDQRRFAGMLASLGDEAAIERGGLGPLKPELAAIDRISGSAQISAWIGAHLGLDDGSGGAVDMPLGIWIHQGFRDADHYSVHVLQGGLGLGDRSAYLDQGQAAAVQRSAYLAWMQGVLHALGEDNPAARAEAVLQFETRLAQAHGSAEDAANVARIDNPWAPADFARQAPGIDWSGLFASAGLTGNQRYVVYQPGMVTALARLAASEPVEVWRDYLRLRLISHYAPALPKRLWRDPKAERAALALEQVRKVMPQVLGKAYVETWFSPAARQAARDMVGQIRVVFAERINRAAWMEQATRQRALVKLEQLQLGLGYPDQWESYGLLRIDPTDPLGSLRRTEALARSRAVAKLRRKVDPGEWAIASENVGALLLLSPNAMQFSAGILQPPYFDPQGDLASNYGSAGAGLAHEVSHSFDPVGNHYDEAGRYRLWWSAEDQAAYKAAGELLSAQLGKACPLADACVKGGQVLGESMADLIGLEVAYEAYHRALGKKADRVIDGLSGDQRFFIAFARRWRRVMSEAALRRYLAGDTHLPPRQRAEAVRHMDGWYAAFAVKPGDPLYLPPAERLHPWGR